MVSSITSPSPLSNATLDLLPEQIARPTYDRTKLTPGIVHIGMGNFHRAHQAWYLHRLMEAGKAHDWAIIGAGVRPNDSAMRDKLLAQDCLTTLIEVDPDGAAAEVIGSIIDFVAVEPGNAPLIAAMSDPRIRIVSTTVTEGGYFLDGAGGLDTSHPDIVHDAANPNSPKTAFGAMVAALRARRDNGHAAFTGQCCDNILKNGDILRQTVVGLAKLSDPDLADWIDGHADFPNSMVDCIVPATGPAELEMARDIGVADRVPVTHERYRQWVMEDRFSSGRPAWEDVGAIVTDQVHLYEEMKLRVLNAGHQILANVGEVLAIPTIADCMQDPLIAGLFRKVQSEEILPHLDPVPEMSPEAYLDLIERRFSNTKIRDTTRRVAFDGSSRHAGFVIPVIKSAAAADMPFRGLALVEAFWSRMCFGVREDGSVIEPNDAAWSSLQANALSAQQDPQVWLRQSKYYGDLSDSKRFAADFSYWIDSIYKIGCRETIRTYLNAPDA